MKEEAAKKEVKEQRIFLDDILSQEKEESSEEEEEKEEQKDDKCRKEKIEGYLLEVVICLDKFLRLSGDKEDSINYISLLSQLHSPTLGQLLQLIGLSKCSTLKLRALHILKCLLPLLPL